MREACDVLIVGGGPAGSSCAWGLRGSGLEVVVIDRAPFPRDKVCAGWITPQVVAELDIDCDDYGRGRTLQPIAGFRTGLIGAADDIETSYDRPVSFGIRRCEFDHYLLERCGARLMLGVPIASICRAGAEWVINGSITARMLVGAGGHFCPVARRLNARLDDAPLVIAQEAEFPVDAQDAAWTTAASTPELYFSRDLDGYGWCFRKQDYLNIGIGLLGRKSLPSASAGFVSFLRARAKIPARASWRWRGHAYLLAGGPRRRVVDDGVLLAGDAAGLAYPQSGEGIRPAVESGLLAASTILEAAGVFTRERLESYLARLQQRFRLRDEPGIASGIIPAGLAGALVPWLLGRRWFTRHLVLDRWFLHAHDQPLDPGIAEAFTV